MGFFGFLKKVGSAIKNFVKGIFGGGGSKPKLESQISNNLKNGNHSTYKYNATKNKEKQEYTYTSSN